MPQLIRALWGDLNGYPKLKQEVINSFKHEFCKTDVIHYVLGKVNADLLTANGAKQVNLVSEDLVLPTPANMNHWHNKIELMNRAMEEFDEILYTDFDAHPQAVPDAKMWEILRSRTSPLNGAYQIPVAAYRHPIVQDVLKLRTARQNAVLNASCVYCNDRKWIKEWLVCHHELWGLSKAKDRITDEVSAIYMADKHFGLLNNQGLVDHFEPHIIVMRRAVPEARAVTKTRYFWHA